MQLRFTSPHLSITDFPTIDLSEFSLITGVNGSGKTHLLQAIANGNIVADIAPNSNEDARYFDWNTLMPADTGTFDGHDLLQQRSNIFTRFDKQFRAHASRIIEVAIELHVPEKYLSDPKRLLSMSVEELDVAMGNVDQASNAHAQIQTVANDISKIMGRQMRKNREALSTTTLLR